MIKLNPNPVTPIITIKPLKLVRSEDELDRMTKMEWRFEVMKARTEVGRALNQYFYDDSCGQNI